MAEDNVDLLNAFTSFDGFQATMINVLEALDRANSASVAILALQALYSIEDTVKSRQFTPTFDERVRTYLRKWRCESRLSEAYEHRYKRAVSFFRSLTVFETFEVPLFIDDWGKKRLITEYEGDVEPININLQKPIVHVTHSEEKEQIVADRRFKPSGRKNIMEGTWFSPKYKLGDPPSSVYGNWAFETTLEKMGVEYIRQGEIVSYKNEVNFILYAGEKENEDEPAVPELRKATGC